MLEIIEKVETFCENAKAIRLQKREAKIGMTVQHEKVAEKWNEFWTKDLFERMVNAKENDTPPSIPRIRESWATTDASADEACNEKPFKRHSWTGEEEIPYLD